MSAGIGARATLAAIVLLALTPGDGWNASAGVPPSPGDEASELASGTLGDEVLAALRAALTTYEATRAALAADDLDGLRAGAGRLADALRAALAAGAGTTRDMPRHVEEAVLAADSMGETESLEAAREAFSRVSRVLVQLAGADPRLGEGWHVFACPMVSDGFNKWIQPSEAIANPYMGEAMPACGLASDWTVSEDDVAWQMRAAEGEAERAGTASTDAAADAASAPASFTPGIPGMTMADVRDFKHLWREIDELQVWERGDRLTVAEFRSKAIEKTVHFLELGGAAAATFTAAAADAVAQVRDAFHDRRPTGTAGGYPDGLGGGVSLQLRSAADRLGSLLDESPRHRLFAPECRKWLLKLAFGPDEDKEAHEAQAGA